MVLALFKRFVFFTFLSLSFNVYSTNYYYDTSAPAWQHCQDLASESALIDCKIGSPAWFTYPQCVDGFGANYYTRLSGVNTNWFFYCNTGNACAEGETLSITGQCVPPVDECIDKEEKMVQVSSVLTVFPYLEDEGCFWVPSALMTCVIDATQCTAGACKTNCYYTYSATSIQPTIPAADSSASFIATLPPPKFTHNQSFDNDDITPVTTTTVDDTVVTTEIQTSSASAIEVTVEPVVDDMTITTVTSPTVQKTTTETTVSNIDNSSTVTTVTNTIIDSSSTSTTTVTSDGVDPSTTTVPSSNVSNVTTTTVDNFDGDGIFENGTSSTTGEDPTAEPDPVKYTSPKKSQGFSGANKDLQDKIVDAKTLLTETVNDIKTDVDTMFSFNVATTAGSLPCPPPVSIPNFGEFDICIDEYEPELLNIKFVLIFVATFLALAIILR